MDGNLNSEKQVSSKEFNKHYIGVSSEDEKQMLKELELTSLDDLFSHIDQGQKISKLDLPQSLDRQNIKEELNRLADKNLNLLSFIGDGLQDFKVPKIVAPLSQIRGLTTAYTPYQPERSQGTLQSLWIYQNALSELTGFEAINASLYDRSTALFEALSCSLRISKKKQKVIVASNIYPGDLEVLKTLAEHTTMEIIYCEIDTETSLLNLTELTQLLKDEDIAGVAFAQINTFGQIESFHEITDLARKYGALSIGIIEPLALANCGLESPVRWGKSGGVDIIVAEAQHLTLAPNFGGPGLGIFGVRYNKDNKLHIRNTAGRYIGKAIDEYGQECKSIILSTREQHIRREKATSNICSNQSFLATLCGASLLYRGDKGLDRTFERAHKNALYFASRLSSFENGELKFRGPFFNEVVVKIKNGSAQKLIEKAVKAGIHLGVDISHRCELKEELILISFSDKHEKEDVKKLLTFLTKELEQTSSLEIGLEEESNKHSNFHEEIEKLEIAKNLKRSVSFSIPRFHSDKIIEYYRKLGSQNLSPDDGPYPLGSCTMKYNPELNDWAASLQGFTNIHPQAPNESIQGCLEVLYKTQSWFQKITGLAAVTTQPVAGAQGELVGLKMFQAYHCAKGNGGKRNKIIIPRSAHGTNPATASMAGYISTKDDKRAGILPLSALPSGEMNIEELKSLINEHGESIAGIMVTNPNTAGIFETKFKEMADLIHSIDALVYMDGANMNAIAGRVDLEKLGVDAVHNNLHKTWSIPHGGGGPGDAIVAVSHRLKDFLPGYQINKNEEGNYIKIKAKNSVGSFHRHMGNFAHKVRAYTYLLALGEDGIRRMSACATLSARYLHKKLSALYPILPSESLSTPRMHEFIITLSEEMFKKLDSVGVTKSQAVARVGKLFLDFGLHSPTVAFPEQYGLMIEPTESFSKSELDRFYDVVCSVYSMIINHPEVLQTVPHFTPISRVNEVKANKEIILSEEISSSFPDVLPDKLEYKVLNKMELASIQSEILKAHGQKKDKLHSSVN